jgi:predicted ATPase
VDKSLVVAETEGPPEGQCGAGEAGRYRLLETVRQYADEHLVAAGEAAAVRGRHRDWCLALAERAAQELVGRDQVIWLNRLEAEQDNLRAALEWSRTGDGGSDALLRLAAALNASNKDGQDTS